MFPMLTPRETFWFSAQLKLPMTERNKKAKVDALIEEVTSWPNPIELRVPFYLVLISLTM
jgi:ABC-type multidrug transport system ATPase subunit